MFSDRLQAQIQFILEIDRLKTVVRQTLLTDSSRQENSAEHSWHLAIMALLLIEHARVKDLDLSRVIKMVLIHDLVEIDAGDTYCYDEAGNLDKAEREKCAADRIFGLLPPDQEKELRGLWEEFEARSTPEARFAAALDRLQPLLNNFQTGGEMWRRHGIRSDKVLARNGVIEEGSQELWAYAASLIRRAIDEGMLPE